MNEMVVRDEAPADAGDVSLVNELAFEGRAEADIIRALRAEAVPLISLVAVEGGRVAGHILFSPVEIVSGAEVFPAMALGPMAVLPERQRRGVGSLLVREGLRECLRRGQRLVFVVGHPGYYPRFGFAPAVPRGFTCEFDVPDETFMLAELAPGVARGRGGLVRYHPAFRGA